MTWALDEKFDLIRQYGVLMLGQTVVINSKGEMIYNGPPPGYDRLKELVSQAI